MIASRIEDFPAPVGPTMAKRPRSWKSNVVGDR